MVADKDGSGDPHVFGIPIKYFVLVLLTVQNAGAVLMMRYVRSMPGEGIFVTQTAVAMQELLKGCLCIAILLFTEGSVGSAYAVPSEALKTAIPALLYLCQNNLQYLGVTLLDAATYTVTYQSKIIFSGILSVLLLGRVLSLNKWVALVLISTGVACVQLSGLSATSEGSEDIPAYKMIGLMMILAAACFSSLAGVSFEKFLKGVKISLWARNLQLAFYSFIIGVVVAYSSNDGKVINEKGFLYGYTPMTWACIAMNAFGGLLVGSVIKYADAILKDMALGLSIVLSTLLSTVFFDFQITFLFMVGMIMVIYSAVLYGGNVDCFGMLRIPPPDKDKPTTAPLVVLPAGTAGAEISASIQEMQEQATEALTSIVAMATGEDEKNVED